MVWLSVDRGVVTRPGGMVEVEVVTKEKTTAEIAKPFAKAGHRDGLAPFTCAGVEWQELSLKHVADIDRFAVEKTTAHNCRSV